MNRWMRMALIVVVGVAAGWLGGLWGPVGAGRAGEPARTVDLARGLGPEAEVKELARGNNAFGADLYRELAAGEQGNLFFSPYSIRTALAMTYAGARGETASQMKAGLRFTLEDTRLHAANRAAAQRMASDEESPHEMRIANSLWGREGYEFFKPFLEVNRTFYSGGLRTVRFPEPGRTTINHWVEERTNDRIKDLIPEGGVSDLTRLVLVNAIYFYGFWEYEFDEDLTRDAPFFVTPERELQVDMMQHKLGGVERTPRFRYLETDRFQAVSLPYKGGGVEMVVLLPKERDGLADMEASLSARALADWLADLDNAPKRTIPVYLPKWKTTWGTKELTAALKALGMVLPFDPGKADFSGMNGARPPSPEALYVSAVFHKTFVDVNEQGTEAAASTAAVMELTAAPGKPLVFRADHPFLYLIRETNTGTVLFMGRVVNPAAGVGP